MRGGVASFTVGTFGVILPFFVGFAVLTIFGLNALESMLVATALTATSIAITVQVLTELGKMQTKEARLILGAAIVDDILAIAVLSVVTTMVQTGDTSPQVTDVIFLILQILALFAALLIGSVFLIPRLLHVERLWKSKGSIEGIVTASFFGAAGIAAFVGLSPIVGAFSVGMAVASTRLIKQVDEYAGKLLIIFGPLFFAIIGAQVDLRGVNLSVLFLSGIVIAIAVGTKVVGCGLPSIIFLKDKTKAFRVGIGMISRGEVGLIVAGVGVSAGVLSSDIIYYGHNHGRSYYNYYSDLAQKIVYEGQEDDALAGSRVNKPATCVFLKELKSFESFILTYIPMRYYLVDTCTDRGTCLFLTKEKMSIRVVGDYRSSGLLPLIPYIPM